MATIIKDTEWIEIAGNVKPDSKKRVILPKTLVQEGITYHIYHNRLGQIVLDPQVTIPASEAWLFKNPEAIAAVRQGLSDAAQGKISKINPDEL